MVRRLPFRCAVKESCVASKGLVIDQHWVEKILNGDKIWEMRSRPTNIRGEIALIAKGTGTIVGFARLTDCLPALAPSEMPSHFARHQIPQEMILHDGFKWFTPWVLTNVRRAERPISYDHPSGAVTWVNLSAQREPNDVRQNKTSRAKQNAEPRFVTTEEELLAKRVVSQISFENDLSIPTNAPISVRRRGNKLYIEAKWDEQENARGSRRLRRPSFARWIDATGIFGVAISVIAAFGLMIHLPLAILSDSFSVLGALMWIPPMLVAMIVAVIGGRADDLGQIFGGHRP